MHFSTTVLAASLLVASVIAGPVAVRNDNDQGLTPICQHLKTENKGCIRCMSRDLYPRTRGTLREH